MYNENGDDMKKGFTLAELLGVTVLLAMVLVLALPALFGIFEEKEMEIDTAKQELITSAAINYVKSNINSYPYTEGQNACIFLKTLVEQNLIAYEVEEELYNRIIKVNMGVNNKYTADILDSDQTCTAYGTILYQVNTCTKDASTSKYTLKDSRTTYYVGGSLIKQIDKIEGKNKSDKAGFSLQASNYETLSNTLKYDEGISTLMNKGDEYFKMSIEFDMTKFNGFTEEEKEALENAPIFYTDPLTLENTCS